MTDLERLLHIEAIRTLKARYFRALDTKEWDTFLSVFTEDAVLQFDMAVPALLDGDEMSPKMVGKAAIAEFVPRDLATARTIHHGHTSEIEIIDDRNARAIWAMDDVVDHGSKIIWGSGHYRETYVREDDGWKIATVHLTRISLDEENRGRIGL